MAIEVGTGVLNIVPSMDDAAFRIGISRTLRGLSGEALKTGGILTAAVTAPLVLMGKQAIQTSIEFEKGLAGVAKTVGDVSSITDPLITGVGESLRAIARESPVAATELLRVGEIAGQLGVEAENIDEFAEAVSKLSISTDLTSEAASFALARFGNVLGKGTSEIDRYNDSLVALGNALPTTESSILSLASRVAGAGGTVGLAGDEILALSAALSSVGVAAELGGTAISRVIIEIANEVATGGEKLALFSEISGQTAEQFTANWEAAPAEALLSFVDGLGQLQEEGSGVFKALEDLGFGAVRVRDVLLRAAGASDQFREALTIAEESTGALDAEFLKFSSTTGARIDIAMNNIKDLFLEFGDAALPVIQTLADGVSSLANFLRENLPGPTKVMIGLFAAFAAALGPFLVLVGGLLRAAANMRILQITSGQATAATNAQTTATDALTTALGRQAGAAQAAATGNTAITSTAGANAALRGSLVPGYTTLFSSRNRGTIGESLAKNFKPSLANAGKGLGVAFGASIISGMVASIETEEGTIANSIKNTTSRAIGGAGFGAGIGFLFGPIGAAVGAGIGAIAGPALGGILDAINEIAPNAVVAGDAIIDMAQAAGFEVDKTRLKVNAMFAGVDTDIALEELRPYAEELNNLVLLGEEIARARFATIVFDFVNALNPNLSPEEQLAELEQFIRVIDTMTPGIEFEIPNELPTDELRLDEVADDIARLNEEWSNLRTWEKISPWAETYDDRKEFEASIEEQIRSLTTLGNAIGYDKLIDFLRDLVKQGLLSEDVLARIAGEVAKAAGADIGVEVDPDKVKDLITLEELLEEINIIASEEKLIQIAIDEDQRTMLRNLELQAMKTGVAIEEVAPDPEELKQKAEEAEQAIEDYLKDVEQNVEELQSKLDDLYIDIPVDDSELEDFSTQFEFDLGNWQANLDLFNEKISGLNEAWPTVFEGLQVSPEVKALIAGLDLPIRLAFVEGSEEERQGIIDSLATGLSETGFDARVNLYYGENIPIETLFGGSEAGKARGLEIPIELNTEDFITQTEAISRGLNENPVKIPITFGVTGEDGEFDTTNIGTGLAEGISDGWEEGMHEVDDAVVTGMEGLITSARMAVGAQSPSTVFTTIGADIIAGLEAGLGNEFGNALIANLVKAKDQAYNLGLATARQFKRGVTEGVAGFEIPAPKPEQPESNEPEYNFTANIYNPVGEPTESSVKNGLAAATIVPATQRVFP